jgi:hypothetical protein
MMTAREKNRLLWALRGAGLPSGMGTVAAQSASASPLVAQQAQQAQQREKQRADLLANAVKSGSVKPEQLSSADLQLVRPNLNKGQHDFAGGFLSDVGHAMGNLGEDIWSAARQSVVMLGQAYLVPSRSTRATPLTSLRSRSRS